MFQGQQCAEIRTATPQAELRSRQAKISNEACERHYERKLRSRCSVVSPLLVSTTLDSLTLRNTTPIHPSCSSADFGLVAGRTATRLRSSVPGQTCANDLLTAPQSDVVFLLR